MARHKSVWQAEDGSYHETEAQAVSHEKRTHLVKGLKQYFDPAGIGLANFERAIEWLDREYDRKPPVKRPPSNNEPTEDSDDGY